MLVSILGHFRFKVILGVDLSFPTIFILRGIRSVDGAVDGWTVWIKIRRKDVGDNFDVALTRMAWQFDGDCQHLGRQKIFRASGKAW